MNTLTVTRHGITFTFVKSKQKRAPFKQTYRLNEGQLNYNLANLIKFIGDKIVEDWLLMKLQIKIDKWLLKDKMKPEELQNVLHDLSSQPETTMRELQQRVWEAIDRKDWNEVESLKSMIDSRRRSS